MDPLKEKGDAGMKKSFCLAVVAVLLLGCRPDPDTGVENTVLPPPDVIETADDDASPVPDLEDVSEHGRSYIGITYPEEARAYPGLARALQAYTDAARGAIDEAEVAAEAGGPAGPFDLFIEYSLRAQTPALVVVAADGSSYLGGAQSKPLVERFVWSVEEARLLPIDGLVVEPEGWIAISNHVREVLHTAVIERVDADEMQPEERERLIRAQARWIDPGTEASAGNFALYEPVFGATGRIRALGFVFPPGQVAADENGTVTAEVPGSVVAPYVAERYRPLFEQRL